MSTYVVEKDTGNLACSALFEPEVNHEATTYFAANYSSILASAKTMFGVDKTKVEDLVQDVFESLARSEEAGKGYDPNHAEDGSIGVAEFVYGRLKMYSKNRKYHERGCDAHFSKSDKSGNGVMDFDIEFASVSDDRDFDSMSAVQAAYATAASYDNDIEAITETASLKNDMQLCIDFSEDAHIDFVSFFKNIDKFATDFSREVFSPLIKAVEYHDQLHDALYNVLSAYGSNRAAFDAALATI